MPTVCIQCALRAVVNGEKPQVFPEEPEEHAVQYHPDPVATRRERIELEQKLMQMPDYQKFVQQRVDEHERAERAKKSFLN